jgi:2-polyprenyl-3-methyl-5-hydroxy-6-metoxy-1,4-benzoquinol methylase
MKEFWDNRYGVREYAYGEKPNSYFKNTIEKLPTGKILLPAEGEGRNAVYAAKLGWDVSAYDGSIEGIQKANKLAKNNGVTITYRNESHESFQAELESFDCIVLIFAHLPSGKRSDIHKKLSSFLKPGGTIILEGFSKRQINKNSGGPRNIDMLFSKEEILKDFQHFHTVEITEEQTILNEGSFHKGNASVIRMLGKK